MEEEVLLAAVDPGITMPEASPAEPAALNAQGPALGTPNARPMVPEAHDGPAATAGAARGETPESESDALQRDNTVDSLDSPEDVAEHDVSAIISSMTKHTRLAMSYRKKDQTTRAIKQMNLALGVCDGRESAHPAVAVEAARVRLNLGAMLSRGGRHLEALVAIKDAQRGLHSVLSWVGDCGAGDPGVVTIEKEARSLQCAAVVAEAIELEPYSQNDGSSSSGFEPSEKQRESEAPVGTVRMVHEQLYAKAKLLAETCLAPSHPVASLARRLSTESAVPASPLVHKGGARLSAASSPASRKARPSMFAGGVLPADASRPPGARGAADGGGSDALQTRYMKPERSPVDSTSLHDDLTRPASSKGKPRGARSTSAGTVSLGRTNRHGSSRGEGHDLFAAFLRDAAEEKEARRGAFADSWQDDARKRLAQVHKRTRLLLQLSEDVELKDKKYTANGHKVMMESLTRDNKSRSDPALVKEARSNRDTPEVYQVRKLNRKLYVKPQTPQPPPPPPKPLMDDDLAQIFRRPTPNPSPTNF